MQFKFFGLPSNVITCLSAKVAMLSQCHLIILTLIIIWLQTLTFEYSVTRSNNIKFNVLCSYLRRYNKVLSLCFQNNMIILDSFVNNIIVTSCNSNQEYDKSSDVDWMNLPSVVTTMIMTNVCCNLF